MRKAESSLKPIMILTALIAATNIGAMRGQIARASDNRDSTEEQGQSHSAATKLVDYSVLLKEIDAERLHIDKLESAVKALQDANSQLRQQQSAMQGSATQNQKQISTIQKTLGDQLGPRGFGDTINSFFGEHTFSLVGGASTGVAFSRQSGQNQFTLDFEVNPLVRLNSWLNFYASIGAQLQPGGVSAVGPSLANLEIFPFGWEAPFEVVAGLFDEPFGDWYENQSPSWVNPFITAPLVYGAERIVPGSAMGLQARGAVQWGATGQDLDYSLWLDSGPTFESASTAGAIPVPVVGELTNGLTGTNLSTNGKGVGGRFRLYPIPVDYGWGRLELMATSYNGKWQNSHWYNAWGLGYAYRVGAFRTRGEWAQSYRAMPSLSASAAYPGCCGHDNRQGWYMMAGYHLYGIPHPDLGKFLERRFDKIELLMRYSGVNQRAIVANDISTTPVFGFNGSPSIFTPHSREVALALDYWFGPSLVWQTEVDWELPRAGGKSYTFKDGASTPVAGGIGATPNDLAVLSEFSVGF